MIWLWLRLTLSGLAPLCVFRAINLTDSAVNQDRRRAAYSLGSPHTVTKQQPG